MGGKREAAFLTENQPFAKSLRGLMDEHKENQKELAIKLGVKQQTISYYRNGQSLPDAANLIKLAKHYGVSTDYLLGLTDVKSTDPDIQTVCDTTGLTERTIWLLMSKRDFDGKSAYSLLVNLIDELAISTQEVAEIYSNVRKAALAASVVMEDENAQPRRNMEIEMLVDSISADRRNTPGMIRIPAEDAVLWYINRAYDGASSIVRRSIEDTTNQIIHAHRSKEPKEQIKDDTQLIEEAQNADNE